MKIFKNLLFTALLCFSHSAFASPVQEKTLDEFFKVSELKAITLSSFKESDLKDIGVTKEEFWQKFEPEIKRIYLSQTTEEELLKSIEYYQSPEVQISPKENANNFSTEQPNYCTYFAKLCFKQSSKEKVILDRKKR